VSIPFDTQDSGEQMTAAVDLAKRAGARSFEIGYLHEGVPIEEAGWYAHALYQGARVTVDNQAGPIEAADGLARKLLTGARCGCGKPVALGGIGKPGECAWHREGPVWVSACGRGTVRPPRYAR
jgi:hypothetical protein